LILSMFKYCHCSHESCSSCTDDGNCFHGVNCTDFPSIFNCPTLKDPNILTLIHYFYFFCHLFSI
jgi:hypothetical protein